MKSLKLNASSLPYVKQKVDELIAKDSTKEWRVSFSPWKDKRSVTANAAYNAWLVDISDFLALTLPETTGFIKLNFGLPIIYNNEFLGEAMIITLTNKGFYDLDYESQSRYILDKPVTRLMDTSEHKRLRDDIQAYFLLEGLILDYKG